VVSAEIPESPSQRETPQIISPKAPITVFPTSSDPISIATKIQKVAEVLSDGEVDEMIKEEEAKTLEEEEGKTLDVQEEELLKGEDLDAMIEEEEKKREEEEKEEEEEEEEPVLSEKVKLSEYDEIDKMAGIEPVALAREYE